MYQFHHLKTEEIIRPLVNLREIHLFRESSLITKTNTTLEIRSLTLRIKTYLMSIRQIKLHHNKSNRVHS